MGFGDDPIGDWKFPDPNWPRKAIWENVPKQHQDLDVDGYLEGLLKVFQLELEDLRQKIEEFPDQRNPYLVRGKEDEGEDFYVTSATIDDDETYGIVMKLVGATAGFPIGYTPIEKIGPYWTMQYEDVTYTAVLIRSRNYPESPNEIWITGSREVIPESVFPYTFTFFPPSLIDYLAQDFGFMNDLYDPEFVQRSAIANVTKYFGLKSTYDSYRIRGEISGFDVEAVPMYYVCDEDLWNTFPSYRTFRDPSDSTRLYTDIEARRILFDDISADVLFYDEEIIPPEWVAITDNDYMYEDNSDNGMSIGLSFAIDITQSGIEVLSSTALTPTELDTYELLSGYRLTVSISPDNYNKFTFRKGVFGLTPGYPANLNDTVYWIDVEESYVSGTEIWTVICSGVDSIVDDENFPGYGSVNASLRYWPETRTDCCFCRSYRMNLVINATQTAIDSYGTGIGLSRAITRLIDKIRTLLVPIHVQVMEYIVNENIEISAASMPEFNVDIESLEWTEIDAPFRYYFDYIPGDDKILDTNTQDVDVETEITLESILTGVVLGATITDVLSDGDFLGATQVLLDIDIRGDLNDPGETMDCQIDNGVDTPTTVYSGQTGFSDSTWRNVVNDLDVTSICSGHNPVTIKGIASATVSATPDGQQRWIFTITK